MKVGFFSPLPPARTGVADYAAALLRALQPLGQVAVNSDDAGICLYHTGNNQLHRDIYRRALERPGVAVLHDAVLHHFFLGSLSEREYVAEFMYNYGAWTEQQAQALWQRRARSATDPDFFRYPMLKRLAERSLALVVHNPRAAEMVREHAPECVIHEIPHLFEAPEPPPTYEVARLRASLGIPAHTFLFGVFGHLRESKRLTAVLRAFEGARQSASIALLVAGDFVSPDLARSAGPLLNAPGIVRVPYTPEHDFWRYASAVDACINLRHPSAGETSGIAIRLMGIGKPVIVTEGCETARFPQTACLRVSPGVDEEHMLADFMVWLATFPADAAEIGRRAQRHIAGFHDPARVAKAYWHAMEQASALL